MSPFVIRRLVAADAAAFKRVRLRALADHPDVFTSTVEDWDMPLEKFVARIEAGHVIGGFLASGELAGTTFLATHEAVRPKTRHKCEIWSVYVAPEARGTGLGEAMMRETIALGRSLGFSWLKLNVAEHNHAARKLYEKLGFVQYGREEDYLRLPDGRCITELLLQLRL